MLKYLLAKCTGRIHPDVKHEADPESFLSAAPGAPWFAVQHKPNCELLAVRNLERQGVRVFTPHEAEVKKLRERTRTIRTQLFPGYVFINFCPDDFRWRTINSTFGVSRIVSFGDDQPAPVPHGIMAALMGRCDPSGRLMPADDWQQGDIVRIAKGPLSDFVGTVEQLAPQQRVWLLLELMGRTARVAVSREELRKVR